MKGRRAFILASAIVLILAMLACDVSFNLGGEGEEDEEKRIPVETAVELTLAARGGSAPTNTVGVTAPTDTQSVPPGLTLTPSATPQCNRPKFQYETIPDNTNFPKNTAFTKSWTIRNDGACTWDSSYRFVFTSGTSMGGPASQALPKEVPPGDTVTISVNLVSPNSDGYFTGYWKLKSGTGELFGNYWVTISSGTPPPPPAAFAVTSAPVSAEHVWIDGICPLTFNVGADITVNGPGTVTYWFVFSNGTSSAAGSHTFAAAGTKLVTTHFQVNATGDYWAKLYVDKPNHQYFGPVNLHANCGP
jgi:hypothetical protein